jgi:aminomethyltransferase
MMMLSYVTELFEGDAEIKSVKGNDVLFFAHGIETDYVKLRHGTGMFPLTFMSYLKIIGDDSDELLDALLTKSVQYLNYGQNRMCYVLSELGEIDAFITLYKNDDHYLIEVFDWQLSKLGSRLTEAHILFERLNYCCILFEGVSAIDFIMEDLELPVDYFVYQSHQGVECLGQDIMVARTGYTGEYGYKFIGKAESIKAIWGQLLPRHSDKLTGYAALELCQYEIKQPFWELPYLALSTNIFELDYHWLVDFKKDIDYSGKRALYEVKAAKASRELIGALSESISEIGATVLLDGETIGKVVDSRLSLGLNKYLTLLFLEKEYAHANIPLQTSGGEKLLTVSAPYVYPSSWSAKVE